MGRYRYIFGKLVASVIAAVLVLAAVPAEAAPVRIGRVTGLDITVSKPADSYAVASDWNDVAGATSYRVNLTSGGIVLQSARVTASAWTATTTLGAGTRVTVKVVPMVGTKAGKATGVTKALPDLTAPTGTFTVLQSTPGARTVTVIQATLLDDVTSALDIVRTINWDDGTPASRWTLPVHTYAADLRIYHPTVTLEDAAGNTRVVPLGTVVVGDHTAPTAGFGATSAGWAGWTRVALTETLPCTDNLTDAARVTRTVAWGDGSTDSWTGAVPPTHVYTAAGSYRPSVTLTDEAGNTAEVSANTVQVAADTARPAVSVTKPTARRTWLRKWATLRGKATDAATGVAAINLRLVEKRGTAWYAYHGTTRRWVRGGTTQAAALRRTTVATVRPTVKNTWSYKVSGLRPGRLVVQAWSVDNVANVSKRRTVAQTLTHS